MYSRTESNSCSKENDAMCQESDKNEQKEGIVTMIKWAYQWSSVTQNSAMVNKKSLKIPKEQSESVYRRRTDNTMDKRKKKYKKDKQRSTKHTHKTKDRVTRTPLKTGGELRCSGRVGNSCSTSDTRRVSKVIMATVNHTST